MPRFPDKLWNLIHDPMFLHVRWTNVGFVIESVDTFVEQGLPKILRVGSQNSLPSFIRQLNLWGFSYVLERNTMTVVAPFAFTFEANNLKGRPKRSHRKRCHETTEEEEEKTVIKRPRLNKELEWRDQRIRVLENRVKELEDLLYMDVTIDGSIS